MALPNREELSKYFTEDQQKDVIELYKSCKGDKCKHTKSLRTRKPDPNHIPRPVNSFMIYRLEKQSHIRMFCPTANHRHISRIVALWWHNANTQEKLIYISKAAVVKKEHAEKYPNYTFRPKTKKHKLKTAVVTKNFQKDITQFQASLLIPTTTIKKPVPSIVKAKSSSAHLDYAKNKASVVATTYEVDYDFLEIPNTLSPNFNCDDHYSFYKWYTNSISTMITKSENNCSEVKLLNQLNTSKVLSQDDSVMVEKSSYHYFVSATPDTQALETPIVECLPSLVAPEK